MSPVLFVLVYKFECFSIVTAANLTSSQCITPAINIIIAHFGKAEETSPLSSSCVVTVAKSDDDEETQCNSEPLSWLQVIMRTMNLKKCTIIDIYSENGMQYFYYCVSDWLNHVCVIYIVTVVITVKINAFTLTGEAAQAAIDLNLDCLCIQANKDKVVRLCTILDVEDKGTLYVIIIYCMVNNGISVHAYV